MAKKILVVDDDLEIQAALRNILESAGYQVLICDNGKDAEKDLLEYQPDLLVLDVMLPGMDGFTLARKLTDNESTRNLPIVVLSGLEPAACMFQSFPQVAVFLHKPFAAHEFLEAVRKELA